MQLKQVRLLDVIVSLLCKHLIHFARLQHGVSKAQDKHSAYTYTMAQVLFPSSAIQRIHIYSDIFTSRRTPIFHFTTNNTKAGFMILC